jgi:N-glycosylase/DNA lyase
VSDPTRILLPAPDYDLAATLSSGQVFRWRETAEGWEGIVRGRWARLRAVRGGIEAATARPQSDWSWLRDFLQVDVDLRAVLEAFPADEPLRQAVLTCRGLRLLRQEPWECLASFLCSATKQIVQIQQMVSLLCERLGERVAVPCGHEPAFTFPGPERLAAAGEAALRACKLGFRAPHLLAAAHRISRGEFSLDRLASFSASRARRELETLPGVGPKIADCVLLFAYGRPDAFPMDVWVLRALRELYFPGMKRTPRELREFSRDHFGASAGYAQQYLFHYIRVHRRRSSRQDGGRT